jgi:hypothetical protein
MWKCKHACDKKNAAKGKPPEDIHDYLFTSATAARADGSGSVCGM